MSPTIEQRVEALEKNARRWRALSLVLAAGLVAVVVGAAGPANVPEVADSVKTKNLVVVRANGERACEISTIDTAVFLTLYDEHGKSRAALEAGGPAPPTLNWKVEPGTS